MRGPYLETQGHDARPVLTARERFQRRMGQAGLALGILCAVVAMMVVFGYSESYLLPPVYLLACIISFALLFAARKNLFSALGIGALWYVVSFLLGVPFYLAVPELASRMPDHSLLALSVGLSLLALLGYALGTLGPFQWIFRPVLRWVVRTKVPLRPGTHAQFVVLAAWVVVAGVARVALGLEAAGIGERTVVPGTLAGILGYTLRGGTLVLIGLFTYRVLGRGLVFLIESIVLVAGYAVPTLLLGWKSALIAPTVVFMTAFWYHAGRHGRRQSILWVLVLVALFPITMSIGQAERAGFLGGAAQYARGPTEFALKVVTRLDGNARFVAVLDHEMTQGMPSWTNNFKLISLIRQGIMTVQYADWYVFGHDPRRATSSSGATGPGGAYIAMGVCGILLGFLIVGAAMKALYGLVNSLADPSLAIALYGMAVIHCHTLFVGNFGLELMAKRYFLYILLLFAAKMLLVSRQRPQPLPVVGRRRWAEPAGAP